MHRLILIAAAALALAATASTAGAYPVAPDGITPAWMDSAPVAPIIDTTDPTQPTTTDDPTPAPEQGCPSSPTSLDPNAACGFDPLTYYLWPGDDADAPLWTRCNYDSGSAADPCPHSRVGDSTWYFQCGRNGQDNDGEVGVEFGGPETDQQWRDDVSDNCGGTDWRSLSMP